MSIHESGQMYLETIYILSQNKSYVRAIDVGEHLGYSKPSVSRAMSILKKNGYVLVDADGAITLTESGMEIAQTMYTRHIVLSEMLMRLGVDEKTATEDACRIEHVISEESFLAVKKHLEWSVAQSVKGQRDSVE
ncbi:iron dependent repressor DNA binding domain protein [Pseudoflavonifractor capillosus ATCC 29799]|uniref:Iron dependent repressor DNA binding domain protein n=1 Tax=Pseudoflavonifractor capillosus ATCC 29799 TaxID=411467 RepID=A6NSS8_9FIRM|nr:MULTISPECIES: metal-dependent transcriptional regulator [Oscillospiraceae]EDN00905.1 iron dependent repressor DNA binding domain protein [Pseudoflavonifractor capillosus ATCC 29799]OUN20381.1 DtxR family transcriptional regulator [Flavonifractor sp. An82]